MKKSFLVTILVIFVLFSLSACVSSLLGGGAEEVPAAESPLIDVAGTVDAEASTQAAQTMAALDVILATPTLEPVAPTDIPPATATETVAPNEESADPTPEADASPEGETPTEDAEGESAAEATPTTTLEVTATLEIANTPAPTATSVYPSPTSPISINMPPESLVPYHRVQVKNTTKGKVYISLQGITAYDYRPVIEYDIPRLTTVKYRIPEGYYKIVVYVGKDPMIAYIQITKNTPEVHITIRTDELRIEK